MIGNSGARMEYYGRRLASMLSLVLFVAAPVTARGAQQEEDFIKPGRPGVANHAEIQKPGVLQLEAGYDANFRAEEFRSQQELPLALRFAANRRLLLALNFDAVFSEADDAGVRMTGVGDVRLGVQAVALPDSGKRPALAFAYYVKLPSASEGKKLGTGRVDHKIVLLLSKKAGQTEVDFNAAYLNVGREGSNGRKSGGQAALSVSQELGRDFGLQGELAGQSEDDGQPRGVFALGALTYKVSRRLQLDVGVRFGLNPSAPRVGVFAGVTVAVADLYKHD